MILRIISIYYIPLYKVKYLMVKYMFENKIYMHTLSTMQSTGKATGNEDK